MKVTEFSIAIVYNNYNLAEDIDVLGGLGNKSELSLLLLK